MFLWPYLLRYEADGRITWHVLDERGNFVRSSRRSFSDERLAIEHMKSRMA